MTEDWRKQRDRCPCGRDKAAFKPLCRSCQKKNYRAEHIEQSRAATRKYQRTHPEKVKELRQRHWKKHKKELYEKSRAWQLANPEKMREYQRAYCKIKKNRIRRNAAARRRYHADIEHYRAKARNRGKRYEDTPKTKAWRKKYRKKHKKHLQKYFKRYYRNNKEQMCKVARDWYAEHHVPAGSTILGDSNAV